MYVYTLNILYCAYSGITKVCSERGSSGSEISICLIF